MTKRRVFFAVLIVLLLIVALFIALASRTENGQDSYKGATLVSKSQTDAFWRGYEYFI